MADEAALINQVRRLVRDYAGGVTNDQVYVDAYYEDANEHGLGVLNFDFDKAWTIDTIPANRVFLLRLLAAIYMCGVRGGEGATTDDSDTASISNITVPDLTVSEGANADTDQGSKFWKDLASQLQAQYDAALKQFGGGDAGGDRVVTQASFTTVSRTTGRERDIRLARAIEADLAVSYATDDLEITLTWSAVYDSHFARYEVLVASSAADLGTHDPEDDPDHRYIVADNHQDWYKADMPAAGTYYLRVDIVSISDLRTRGEVLTISVP